MKVPLNASGIFFQIFLIRIPAAVAGEGDVVAAGSIPLIEAAIGFAAACTLAAALVSLLHNRFKR